MRAEKSFALVKEPNLHLQVEKRKGNLASLSLSMSPPYAYLYLSLSPLLFLLLLLSSFPLQIKQERAPEAD